jgi:hypothetical protein
MQVSIHVATSNEEMLSSMDRIYRVSLALVPL